MKSYIPLALLLLLAMLATPQAQTSQVQWTQPGVVSNAQAVGFQYRLIVTPAPGTGTPNAPIVLTGVTCTGWTAAVPNTTCIAPIGPGVVAVALVTGAKSVLGVQDLSSGNPEVVTPPFTAVVAVPTGLKIVP